MGLFNLGHFQIELGDYAGAKRSDEEALAILRKILPPEHPDIALCLTGLGRVQAELRNYAGARKDLEEALLICRKALPPDHPLTAQVLNSLGIVHWNLRDYARARQRHEEALAIRRKSLPSDHPDIAASLAGLGNVQSALREYAAAVGNYEEALAILRKAPAPNSRDIAMTLNNLGNVQLKLLDYAAAKRSNEEALAIRRRTLPPGHPEIAQSLVGLGNVQTELHNYANAKQSLQEAVAIYRSALPPDHPDIGGTLGSLGGVQTELRDYAGAKQSFEEALALHRKTLPSNDPAIAFTLNHLANLQRTLQDVVGAKRSLEEALAIRRTTLPPNHPDIADSLNDLGLVQGVARDYAGATRSIEEALAIYREVLPRDHPKLAISLNNLGLMQAASTHYADAKRSFEQALAICRKALPRDHPGTAKVLNNLGITQVELRDHAGARRSLEEALAIYRAALPHDHPAIALSLSLLGCLSLATQFGVGESLPRFAEATNLLLAEQLRMAVLQDEQEQLATAALARWSLGNLISATLIAETGPDLAYNFAVQVKGSVTALQRWVRHVRDVADPETARLLGRLRETNRRLVGLSMDQRSAQIMSGSNDLPKEIRALSLQRDELERELMERSAAYRNIQARAKVGSAAIRAALPQDTALIDLVNYLHLDPSTVDEVDPSAMERMVAFVVRPDRPDVVIVRLGTTREVADLIKDWRGSYGAGKAASSGHADPGVELRKRLWEPLAKHLEGVKLVLVSPDGPLNGLPWAALLGSHPGTFLVHEYAFAVVPVPQLLPELVRGKPRPANEQPSLLLAGGIAFGEQSAREAEAPAGKLPPVPVYRPLPGTESEVNDLAERFRRRFHQAPAPLVLGEDQATKQAILAAAPAHRFLHLATHGFFAGESELSIVVAGERAAAKRGVDLRWLLGSAGWHPGLLSGLVFAGVNRSDRRPEDTILTALEASELELEGVELVVLSACNTGRGQVAGGEGVLGLQRAFQLAGARSVVASLWKVPDEETHQLMREFYRRVWAEKPISRAEALRQAQLWMLEHWKGRGGVERPDSAQGPPPPYVWAAFVLSGDWR